MKLRRSLSMLAIAGISLGICSLAVAQPAPPPPRGFVPPPPPRGVPAPPPQDQFDHRDDHHGDHHDDADRARREQEARDREIARQKADRDRRKQARKDEKAWHDSRQHRAEDRRKEIEQQWGNNVLNRQDARAELSLHADRMARLNRLLDIAEDKNDPAMTARVQDLMNREIARDARVMAEIRANAGVP